jgi:RNA polymerase sigma-70 factor (ECF subfamily)
MSDQIEHPLLRFIRRIAARGDVQQLHDGQLLERFVAGRDEAAFAMLVSRHGAMVWRVCWAVLRESHIAEDAFQATFLVLVRKAPSIARPELLANWLYGVAHRVARRARKVLARQQGREQQGAAMVAETSDVAPGGHDLEPLLQEELQRLPAKYRSPMVLCYLEGQTNEEAARQLQWPVGTLKVRLLRGRELLKTRLTRRGVPLPAAPLAGLLMPNVGSALPAALADTTIKAAMLFAAGKLAAGAGPSANAVALARGVLKTMWTIPWKTVLSVLLVMAVFCAGAFAYSAMNAQGDIRTSAVTLSGWRHLANFPAQPSKIKSDVEKLQGTWSLVTLEMNGLAVQDNPLIQGAKIIVKGDTFTTVSMGATYNGTFKVDATKSPKTIDMTYADGPEKGNTSLAIYELEGDAWKLCIALTGKERPREFAARAGTNHALETLKRQTDDQAQEAIKKELALLEGEWSMVSGEIGGQKMPDEMLKTAKRVGKGNETTTTMGGQLFMKATITIDPTKKPKTIDYQMTDGFSKGKTQFGIYEVNGDTVRFCFASPGKDRPPDFTTKAGDDRTLSVWKRK